MPFIGVETAIDLSYVRVVGVKGHGNSCRIPAAVEHDREAASQTTQVRDRDLRHKEDRKTSRWWAAAWREGGHEGMSRDGE